MRTIPSFSILRLRDAVCSFAISVRDEEKAQPESSSKGEEDEVKLRHRQLQSNCEYFSKLTLCRSGSMEVFDARECKLFQNYYVNP